jgi:RNA polymerase sigma factor (sigma-70 family)
MKDEKIIKLIRTGKHSEALDRLYKGYPAVRKFIINHGGNEDDARDIFQEALVVFCSKAGEPDFTLTAQISTYLYSVCRFKWKDQLEAKGKFITLADDYSDGEDNLKFSENDVEDQFAFLDKILLEIGNNCRKILEAYYFHKNSMEEIARQFGYNSQGSAKNQKYKCLEKARSLAKKEYEIINREGAKL